jgi:hypothetical protein
MIFNICKTELQDEWNGIELSENLQIEFYL